MYLYGFFFFKQKTAYEMRISDWSSDVCSSDLANHTAQPCIALLVRHHPLLQRIKPAFQFRSLRAFQQQTQIVPAVIVRCTEILIGNVEAAHHQPLAVGDGKLLMIADQITRGASATDRKSKRLNSSH